MDNHLTRAIRADVGLFRLREPQRDGTNKFTQFTSENQALAGFRKLVKARSKTMIDLEELASGHWMLRRRWSKKAGESVVPAVQSTRRRT